MHSIASVAIATASTLCAFVRRSTTKYGLHSNRLGSVLQYLHFSCMEIRSRRQKLIKYRVNTAIYSTLRRARLPVTLSGVLKCGPTTLYPEEIPRRKNASTSACSEPEAGCGVTKIHPSTHTGCWGGVKREIHPEKTGQNNIYTIIRNNSISTHRSV